MSLEIYLISGTTLTVPYNADLMAFTHEDFQIRNPLLSECGRFWVSAETYGFEPFHTGGGCMALRRDVPGDRYLLLTSSDGSHIPDKPEDADTAILGLYTNGGDTIATTIVGEIPMGEDDQGSASPPELTEEEAAYLAHAQSVHQKEGDLEFDDNAKVSISEDGGAYVQGWKWIDRSDVSLPGDEG